MSWVRNLFVIIIFVMRASAAHAQTGCVPNPNDNGPLFTDGCRISAVGLNKLVGTSTLNIIGYPSTAACNGVADVTSTIQNDLLADSAKGGGLYYLPKAKGCVISSANLNVPFNMQIKCADLTGGYWTSGNFPANSDILLSPSFSIKFGTQLGGRSGISGCLILNQNYTTASTMRQAITAAAAFAGTAITCSGATDVNVDDNLIIGFATAVTSACDRFHFVDNRGDDTNFLSLTACADTCTIHDDEAWPFAGSPYVGFTQFQTTTVTGATIGGGGTNLTLTFAAPPTPIVTGDTVILAKIGGITGAQFGRFTATAISNTSLSVTGTFSGSFTSGGTVYLSTTSRHGTGFNIAAGMAGGPLMARLYDYGHDIALHYAPGSVAQCQNCWLDNDTSLANLDPVPVGLQLDGSSGLTNVFQGFINEPGIGIIKNDASILTVGPGSHIGSFNTSVGTYVIQALQGAIQFDGADVFTNLGLGSGQALFIGNSSGNISLTGSALNGTVTFQSVSLCPLLRTNGTVGPCSYTPTYTGASIAGTPLQSIYWIDANGKTSVFYNDSGHTVSGATSTQFSISLPSTSTFGGVCSVGLISATFPTSTTEFIAQVTTGASAATFSALGSLLTSAVPGTALGTPDVLEMFCTYQ